MPQTPLRASMTGRILAATPLAGMIVAMSCAQLVFKQAGLHARERSQWVETLALNPWLWIGLGTSGVGMVCWLLTLRRLPLATAYPWTAFVYVLTPLAGSLIFREALSRNYLVGMTLVVLGVYFTAGGVRTR